MSCSLDAPRGADFTRRYVFPESYDWVGFPATFNIYETTGGTLLLSVIAISNANGSETLSLDNVITVNVTKEDLALLPQNDDPTLPSLLRYELLLTSPDLTVTDLLASGGFRVLPFGFRSCGLAIEEITVSIGGDDVDVTIDGGSISSLLLAGKADTDFGNVSEDTFGAKTFNVWPSAEARSIRDELQRTYVPDDVKLSSQSDLYGWQTAFDKAGSEAAAGRGVGIIQALARSGANAYALNGSLDISAYNNVSVRGAGASDYGKEATRVLYTGTAGGILIDSNPALLNAGIEFHDLTLDGNGLASRVMRIIAGTNWTIYNLRCIGATSQQVYMDSSENYGCGQFSRFIHWDISCTGQPSSAGLVIGPGRVDQDCYAMTFDQLRIIHYDGIGLDIGAADTITFRQTLVQRTSGTGWSIRHKGGDAPGSNVNQSYEVTYENYFADGEIVLEAGANPPRGINFLGSAAKSGSSIPQFLGSSSGSYSDYDGYTLTRYGGGAYNHTTAAGLVRLGDATPGASAYRQVITDATGAVSADIRSGLAANTGSWGRAIDGAGRLITKALNDDGSNGQTAYYIERTGSAVTGHRTLVGGVDKLTVDANGIKPATLGNYANDAAAAAGGVPVGYFYRNGSVVMVRVV